MRGTFMKIECEFCDKSCNGQIELMDHIGISHRNELKLTSQSSLLYEAATHYLHETTLPLGHKDHVVIGVWRDRLKERLSHFNNQKSLRRK